jgi:hypothetical protein
VKKAKRPSSIRTDDSKPGKPAVPPPGRGKARDADVDVPTYRGPTKAKKAPPPKRGRKAKDSFDAKSVKRPRRGSKNVELGDQQARRRRGGTRSADRDEQYVRLRIRVRNGGLTVVDSHLVDGPLGQVTGFPGTNAYEVTLGDRLLHAGALPDLGVQRSFPNPEGPTAERGHHITQRDVHEFTARVPAADVTRETIGRIAVRLHRVKEEAHARVLGAMPLGTRFEREVRPVAELVGLPQSALPEAIEKRGGRTPSA